MNGAVIINTGSRDAITVAPAAPIQLAFQPVDNPGCDDADRHRFTLSLFHRRAI